MVYYLGYDCPYASYPRASFADGDYVSIKTIDRTPEPGLTFGVTHDYLIGRAVESKNVPTILKWESKNKPTDYDTPGGFPCVSPAMKEMIEGFEPGVHQFFRSRWSTKKRKKSPSVSCGSCAPTSTAWTVSRRT